MTDDEIFVSIDYSIYNHWYVSVDGTDWKLYEPAPLSFSYCCHNHNGYVLKYEVAVNIYNGNLFGHLAHFLVNNSLIYAFSEVAWKVSSTKMETKL